MRSIKDLFIQLMKMMQERKRLVLSLSCLVVFMTTYLLILPAFTLEKDEAIKQGGIDIGTEASEDVSDEKSDVVTADEDEAAVEPSDKKDTSDVKKTDKKAKADTAKDAASDPLTFEGEGFSVAVEDTAGVLPEETSIEATELVENPTEGTKAERKAAAEDYRNYYDKALEAINDEAKGETDKKISFVKFYDITLQSGDEVIQPEKPVNVTISYDEQQQKELKVEEKKNVRIIHFAEDEKTGEITAEIIDDKNVDVTLEKTRMTDTTFEAEGFSVYGIVYTVDFHWEVDGKKFDFSIPGGGYVSFSQLVEELGMEKEDTKGFVESVESITFSKPELLSVSKVEVDTTVGAIKEALNLDCEYSKELTEEEIEKINAQTVKAGDWALISLKAFDMEESLTVTMKNGDQFVVRVTDAQVSTHVITADGKDYIITVTYGPEAGIPNGSVLKAKEIKPGTDAYAKLIDRTSQLLSQEILSARFFDIEILSNGKKIEPKTSVDMTIQYAQGLFISEESSVSIVHFGDEKTDVITDVEVSEKGDSFTYKQDSFSTTGAVISGDSFSDGKYFIIHRSGDNYYALLNDGTTVQVSYNATSKIVTFSDDNVATRALWDMSNAGTYYTWNTGYLPLRLCTVKGQDGNYLKIDGADIVGDNTVVNLTAEPMNDNTGGFELHNIGTYQMGVFNFIGSDTSLKFSGSSFTTGDSNGTRVLLAKYEVGSATGNPPDVGTYEGKEVDRILLDDWLMSLFSDEPMNDDQFRKTAEVYDYDNRIYQIDFTAQTNARVIMHNMDVAFSLDMSNSMLFPSELSPIGTVEMKQDSLYNDLDESKVYFVISDVDGTATVNALFYEYDSNSRSYKWKYEDASKYAKGQRGGSSQDFVVPNTVTKINSSKDTGYYTLYTAEESYVNYIKTTGNTSGDNVFRNPYNRLTDLNNAITTAFNFLDVMSEKYGITIRVGWNGFARDVRRNESGENYDYRAVNHPLQNLEYVDYREILNAFTTGQTGGGTRPDLAFVDASSNMDWSTDSNTEKILILVTDGAPQGGSEPSGGYHTTAGFTSQLGEAIYQGQQLSANKDVNIITLGLSTEHVKEANDLFENIAYTPTGGEQMKYHATDGIALRYALIDAIRSLTENAVLTGDVTDTIDTAFYPVSSDGTPLEPTDWITLDGVKMTTKDATVPHGVIGKDNNGDWTVTWTNQDIIHADETQPDGWHGKVYVKCKEDFLGGNTIQTNEGNATLDLTGLREKGNTEPAPFSKYFNTESWTNSGWDDPETKTETTPYVNVDDLYIPPQETNWQVYLKTEVDPLTQIKELYKNINVLEVVKQDTADPDHRMTQKEDMVYDLTSASDAVTIELAKADGRDLNGTPQNTIPLSEYLKKWTAQKKDLTDAEWQTLLSGGTVARVYSEYGHTPGEIKLTLTKSNGLYDVHEAVTHEEYTLTAKYEPYDAENVDYKKGEFRTKDSGQPTDEINSTHKHIIDEIKRIITVKKTKMNDTDLDGATFIFYQKDSSGNEINTVTLAGGTATWDYVLPDLDQKVPGDYWKDSTTWYLKEESAPEGYAEYGDEIEINLNIVDTKTVLSPANSNNAQLYMWTHVASLGVLGYDTDYVTVTGNSDISIVIRNEEAIDITVIKTDTDGQEISGAKFMIKNGHEIMTNVHVVKKGGSWANEEDRIDIDEGVFTIPTGGATIAGLKPGTYTLEETQPPSGYIKTLKPIAFTVTRAGVTYDNPTENPQPLVVPNGTNTQYTVQNEPGAALPSTGGSGTNLIYLFGIMLTGIAGAGLVMKRRKGRRAA